jgi:hypothetical protein
VLARDPAGMELRGDPTALAPERLIVFDVAGSIQNFAAAVRRVDGLEWVDEEELTAGGEDAAPNLYLVIPDAGALRQLLSLWEDWQAGRPIARGFTPWRNVFTLLRDLRPWGPTDRVGELDRGILAGEIDDLAEDETIRLEVELVFLAAPHRGQTREAEVEDAVVAAGGSIRHRARIQEIAYHALLVELPVAAVRLVVDRAQASIAGLDAVMHIRPQSMSFSLDTGDPSPMSAAPSAVPTGSPIAAIFDGVPVSEHPLLAGRLRVEDIFGLEADTLVANRKHGTAMASLVLHGDRNKAEVPLHRPVVVVPVMRWDGMTEGLPSDRLIVSVIYQAVVALRGGVEPLAPTVLIINLSLGNLRRPFHGQMSPWARLLDRLAWQYGILFVVSAGNAGEPFEIPAFDGFRSFEDAAADARAQATLLAVNRLAADRRIVAPAESINALTIGATNDDSVSTTDRRSARTNIDPYVQSTMVNPSSRLGPGFSNSVKPDALMPGGREHLRAVMSGGGLTVQPAGASRAFGLKVAAPRNDGTPVEHYTNGTSAAAALATRTCHRIHDSLEQAYGEEFLSLPHIQRALILKAVFAHAARWPQTAAALIRASVGPADPRQHVKQKDNIRRFLGYGALDADETVACAADRVTFWATALLPADQAVRVDVPIPRCMAGLAQLHSLSATLAWFTPVQPGRNSYRSVRLGLFGPEDNSNLRVAAASDQPDANQVRRGTLLSRRWSGARAPIVTAGMLEPLIVQRDPDQGIMIDDPVPFALAVTVSMPGIVGLYDEVRTRLQTSARARA